MSWKFVPALLAAVARKKMGPVGADSARTIIKDILHEEVLSLTLRIMLGAIVTAVVIFSIIMVGQQVNRLFLGLPEGPALSILVFGLLAVGGIFFLYNSYGRKTAIEEAKEDLGGVNFSRIASNFLEGIKQGASRESHNRRRIPAVPVYRPEVPPVNLPPIPDVNRLRL